MSHSRLLLAISCSLLLLPGCVRPRDSATAATATGEYLFCFWNVENLFDDRIDGWSDKPDKELDYWFAENPKILREKLDHLSRALVALN
ncbi:MAG TPA: hypothetical protein VKE94_16890, partial [Gemmataceae bacterium]|nr:hypothetical protein [Gemmataceae bacterium]